jgi:hypothetical protein
MKKIFTLLLIMAAFTLQSRAQSNLVINEIDYDQPAVDSAEFIEMYNASGTPVNLGDYTM